MGAAAILQDERGWVLLVRHTYGHLNWELPGGISEEGESILETVLREVLEETGLKVEAEGIEGIYYEAEPWDIHQFLFRCRIKGDAGPIPSSPEISECAYWPAQDLPRPINSFTVRRIEDAVSGETRPLPISMPPRVWFD
jgi:8-oxo-dGTP diphosphatase